MQNNKKKINNTIVLVKYFDFIINYYPEENTTKELLNIQLLS